MEDFEKIRACALCGSAVLLERTNSGTSYYVPVDMAWLDRVMKINGSDEFILDRLRRAESIITQLRKEVADLKNERN